MMPPSMSFRSSRRIRAVFLSACRAAGFSGLSVACSACVRRRNVRLPVRCLTGCGSGPAADGLRVRLPVVLFGPAVCDTC